MATLGFLGFSPIAPGTVGTLAAFGLVALLGPSDVVLLVIALLLAVIGTVAADKAEKVAGETDPQHVVVDEAVGYMVSVLFLPRDIVWLVAAFILFRVFDILKPPPIGRLQKLRGGLGIMADDVAAGIYSNLVLQLWRLTI